MNHDSDDLRERFLALLGHVLQALFSLNMIGGMFLVWIIVNEAQCNSKPERWVAYTGWQRVGKGDPQLLAFPLFGAAFLAAAIRAATRKRKPPEGYLYFAGIVKLLVANALLLVAISTNIMLFCKTEGGPGQELALGGAIGIGLLGLVRVARHVLPPLRSKRSPPPPERSERRSLRLIGVADYVIAAILLLGVVAIVGAIGYVFLADKPTGDVGCGIYGCIVLVLCASAMATLGTGIRAGEGWAALAHLVLGALLCLGNVLLIVLRPDIFLEPGAPLLVWSLFPFSSAAVLYILFFHARRDITWPIRLTRCHRCSKRGIWQASACPTCGNPMKPIPGRPDSEYCIYCRKSLPAVAILCRSCRKQSHDPTGAIDTQGDR